MKSAILTVFRRAGIDRAVGYSLLSQGWTVLSGPINLFFVVTFFSKVEQGFYYTFASMLGLQVFFHLGLGLVVLQFVSHERAFLEWSSEGALVARADLPEEGERARARLASLLRGVSKWYGAVSLAFALVMPIAGAIFFSRHQGGEATSAWLWPWLFVSLIEAGNLFVSPFAAVVEGCGLVAQTRQVALSQNVASSLVFWLVLALGGALWGTTVAATVALVWGLSWVAVLKRPLFLDLWRLGKNPLRERDGSAQVDWKREIWPLQWKIALSWLSSYFIFSLFVPVAFAWSGPVAAGRVGLSTTIASAIWTMAFSWISTKAAPFGSLIAERNWSALDAAFFPALWRSTALVGLGAGTFWLVTLFLHMAGHRLATRVLDPLPLALLLGATLVNHLVASMGLYLRAHKEEPFVWLSVISAALMGLSTFLLGRFFGVLGMMAGYFAISSCVSLSMAASIFQEKRRQWHIPTVPSGVSSG